LAKGTRRGTEINERQEKVDKKRKTEIETCFRNGRLRQKQERKELNLSMTGRKNMSVMKKNQ